MGIGSGQPNRVDAARIAVQRAGEKARGSVLASDAFFPFPDSVEVAAAAGVTAIVQPGGSIRDAPESRRRRRRGYGHGHHWREALQTLVKCYQKCWGARSSLRLRHASEDSRDSPIKESCEVVTTWHPRFPSSRCGYTMLAVPIPPSALSVSPSHHIPLPPRGFSPPPAFGAASGSYDRTGRVKAFPSGHSRSARNRRSLAHAHGDPSVFSLSR